MYAQNYRSDLTSLLSQPSVPSGSRKKIENYSYNLQDKIGKGYSSVVYRGRNDNTNEVVAIKVIDMKGVRDSVAKEMLDCEIEALRTLKHPHILNCFDVFTTANNCYIITEFCDGGDMATFLKKKSRVPEAETLVFVKHIVSGFIEIAEKNFLHRDLKLANIFLNNGIAKVADFGFAKRNTKTGEKEKYNVGSPLYMSPEALKRNIYSIKSDVWSVGVIIYELLHGQTPWECRTEKELIQKMVKIPVRFSSSAKISDQLKDFIRGCLEVDESKRFGLQAIKNYPLIKRLLNEPSMGKEPELVHRPVSNPVNNVLMPRLENRPSQNPENTLKEKDNNTSTSNNQKISSPPISKVTVDRNNLILVHHINTFRLLYKILDQIKTHKPDEKTLIQLITNEVLSKVSVLYQLWASDKPIVPATLDIKESEKYLNDVSNPGIKKYKAVVTEYHRKYNQQLQRENGVVVGQSLDSKMKEFVKASGKSVIPEKLSTLYFWATEYLLIPRQAKRNYIENIIQPEAKPTEEIIRNRMKLVV